MWVLLGLLLNPPEQKEKEMNQVNVVSPVWVWILGLLCLAALLMAGQERQRRHDAELLRNDYHRAPGLYQQTKETYEYQDEVYRQVMEDCK